MKIATAEYYTSSLDLPGCPEPTLPEFALIGRSNVGKSSLLNMITGRTELARVSETPGKTQMINFFTINKKWRLVDLPGYGYAKVAREAMTKFNESVADYLANRDNLTCVLVLIDSRHPPQAIDLEFINWMVDNAVPFIVVFTKADKLSAARLQESIDLFKQSLSEFCEDLPEMLVTSSKSKSGLRDIHRFIQSAL